MSESNKAVFLSYASQDAEAARRIGEALRVAGAEVWFDQSELVGGDAWDQKIRRQIKECALFVPVISAATQTRLDGYFRIEWELAAQRAMSIAAGVPFILPVVIDNTREPDALVPERFRAAQWTRLRDGEVPEEVRQRLLEVWSHRIGAQSGMRETGAVFSRPAQTLAGQSRPAGGAALGERRLAAIVFTDVVGYSAQTQRDETATLWRW